MSLGHQCPVCRGSGRNIPPMMGDIGPCAFCRGKGFTEQKFVICKVCNGKGHDFFGIECDHCKGGGWMVHVEAVGG